MERTGPPTHLTQPSTRWLPRAAAAFAIGFGVLPIVGSFVPGPAGAFALVGGLGFAGVLILPGWGGFLATATGVTAMTIVSAMLAGFAGLQFLALLFVLPALAAGACAGTIAHAARERGLREALRDPRLWALGVTGLLLAVGLLVGYALLVGSGSPP